jgi:hypothetical protein
MVSEKTENTADLQFRISHSSFAYPIVYTKCKVGLANTGNSIDRTDICGSVLAKLSGILFDGIKPLIAITLMSQIPSLVGRSTFGSMQAYMITTVTDFQFVLALDTKKPVGTDAMLPTTIVGFVKAIELFSKLRDKSDILGANATLSFVFASEAFADFDRFALAEFTNGSLEACGAIATFLSEIQERKRSV